MAKKKKTKHLIGPKEFLFNFLSLVAVIGLGVYFGYRSLYYYSKQNIKIQEDSQTLNGVVIQQNQVVQGDDVGLHLDKNGYFFKGQVSNNYVMISNKLFRIIRIHNDNTIKLISENYVASFMWGEDNHYQNSNVRNWLTKTDAEISGVYYDILPNLENYLVKTKYSEDVLEDDKVVSSEQEYEDYVTTLGIKDYIMANGKSSFLNNSKYFYLLGLNSEQQNLYVEEDGSIQSCDSLEGYGIRPVITLKADMVLSSGDGTIENPYIISLGVDNNYVDGYVKLGDDLWRVYEDKNDVLRMYSTDYIKVNETYLFTAYSNTNSIFDITDRNNIAYYLNTTYLSSLPYGNFILDNEYYIGEISDDAGYAYQNIYSNKVICKVALLNIFDYNVTNEFTDYFHINTTSEVGSMGYIVLSNGLLEEADVREAKPVVPVISISKSILSKGNGTKDNPYVVE